MRKTTIICTATVAIFYFMCTAYSATEESRVRGSHSNKLDSICFVPHSNIIVGACDSLPTPSIRFWTVEDGQQKRIIELPKKDWVQSLAISKDGKLLAATFLGSNEIGCYSLPRKKWLWRQKWVGKAATFNAMGFTPDSQKMVAVGFRNIVTYDALTGTILHKQTDSKGFSDGFPEYRTRNQAISPSAKYAAFWQGNLEHDEGPWHSGNVWVVVRDIEKEETIAKQGKIQEKYKNCSAVFTPDEKNLLLGSMDGRVRLWSIADQKVIKKWQVHDFGDLGPFEKDPSPYWIDAMTFSPDEHYLATVARFGMKIWDYRARKLVREYSHIESSSRGMCTGYPMAFSPEGKYFAFEKQGQLCLYDTATWQEKWCVNSLEERR